MNAKNDDKVEEKPAVKVEAPKAKEQIVVPKRTPDQEIHDEARKSQAKNESWEAAILRSTRKVEKRHNKATMKNLKDVVRTDDMGIRWHHWGFVHPHKERYSRDKEGYGIGEPRIETGAVCLTHCPADACKRRNHHHEQIIAGECQYCGFDINELESMMEIKRTVIPAISDLVMKKDA